MSAEKLLTFAKTVKTELANLPFSTEGMRFGVLSGFTRLNATFSLGKVPSISYATEIASVAKLIFSLVKDRYGVNPRIVFERRMRFDKSMVYVVRVESTQAYDILSDLKVLKNLKPIPLRSMVNPENLKPFLIGCFLASGSVNSPSSKSYFLEIAFGREDDASRVKESLDRIGEFSFKVIPRRDKWVLYLKRSGEIAVFLSFLGSTNAMLNYENARATKDLMNNENRLDICAAHNYSRSLNNGRENVEDISKVLAVFPLNAFDDKSRAVIQARLSHRDASYGELSELLSTQGVEISKSGVSRILSSIREKAKKI